MAEETLLARIGLDISDLKAKAIEGTESIQEIHHGFRELKNILHAGGVALAVEQFFQTMIRHANDAADKTDANTAAVIRFGESLEHGKSTVLDWGVSVLGFFNRAGENIGDMVARMVYGDAAVNKAAQIAKDAAESIAESEESQRQIHEQLAEAYQKQSSALRARAQIEHEQLTTQEQINVLVNEIKSGLEKAATLEEGSLQFESIKAEVLENQNKLIKALGQEKKEQATRDKDAEREREQVFNQHMANEDELARLRYESLSTEGQLSEKTAEMASAQKALIEAKKEGKDTSGIELTIFKDQLEIVKLIAKIKATPPPAPPPPPAPTQDLLKVSVKGSGFGSYVQGSSTAALEGILARLNEQLFQQLLSDQMTPDWNPWISRTGRDNSGMIRGDISTVLKELNLRSAVANDIGMFGEDYARGQYGDASVNRAMQDVAKENASNLRSLTRNIAVLTNVLTNSPAH